MQGLHCSFEEATAIYKADCEIDHGEKQDFDLPPDKVKVAQQFARTGTRKTSYKFTKKERKPNATKAGIIEALFKFLSENTEFLIENVTILNKERQVSFHLGQEDYELTLVQKRKKKE